MSGRFAPNDSALTVLGFTVEQRRILSDAVETAFEAGQAEVACQPGSDGAARWAVWQAMQALQGDELEVLAEVASGLVQGRAVYGQLDLDGDERDWVEEALQEARDGFMYSSAKLVRLRRRLREKGTE